MFVSFFEKIPKPTQVNKQEINVEKGAANQPYFGMSIKFKARLSNEE